MLVLSRHKNQRIFIGPGIVITVVACGLEKVKIGIEAGPEVQIMREELLEDAGLEWWRDRDHSERGGEEGNDGGGRPETHGPGDC